MAKIQKKQGLIQPLPQFDEKVKFACEAGF